MSSVAVSELAFAYEGQDDLFFDVSFRVKEGEHWAIVGENGSGKSTLLRVLAGLYAPDAGSCSVESSALYLPQDIGFDTTSTLRQTLLLFAPTAQREAGLRLDSLEKRVNAGDEGAALELGQAIADWAEVQGYALEGTWDASVRRVVGIGIDEALDRPLASFSGGERKRISIDVIFSSASMTLLLDEPDNYLDVPGKVWLEKLIRESAKTIVVVSHDRELLRNAFHKIITLEGATAWVHGGSFATYADARERRQEALGDALERWRIEERRLFQHMKIMKQRASVNPKNAPKANAAESRWERFRANGPPPPPVQSRPMRTRLRGADGARRAVLISALSMDNVFLPFSDEIWHNERIGLIGPNGTGKTHLVGVLAGSSLPSSGSVAYGNRVTPGVFTQVNEREDFMGAEVGVLAQRLVGSHEASMRILARYGLERDVRLRYESLSGGQKARLEIMALELSGCNLLILDEPTDNLDVESTEALEAALNGFEGACISVSHDRAFLAGMDRYWLLDRSGVVYEVVGWDRALEALTSSVPPSRLRPLSV